MIFQVRKYQEGPLRKAYMRPMWLDEKGYNTGHARLVGETTYPDI